MTGQKRTAQLIWMCLLSLPSARGFVSLQLTSTTLRLAAASDTASSQFRYHNLTDIDRVLCLSDLHTDNTQNLEWLSKQAAASLNRRDLVIVAGDISHELTTFRDSLKILTRHARVAFCNGNHEAWLHPKHDIEWGNSLEKLQACNDVCHELGVYVDPIVIEGDLWILPLQSWYDGTLSFDEELCEGFEHWPWVDFARCRWPFPKDEDRIPTGLVEYFLQRNQQTILDPWEALIGETSSPDMIISFSHFAPNQKCLPDWKNLKSDNFDVDNWLDHGAGATSAKFAKVAGSSLLDDQLRTIASGQANVRHLHVFGHSHRPKDFDYQNIRYIHNPLGKPRERQLYMVNPNVDFQVLWENGKEVRGETVIRYWEERGGGKEMLWKRLETTRPGRYQRQQQ